jgi:hemolysin D
MLWTVLAQIDVVVNAQGKLVPTSFVRSIQAPEAGVVRLVNKRDGESVQQGDLLVQLDPLYAQEDVSTADAQRQRLSLVLQRIDAELSGTPFNPKTNDAAARMSALAEYRMRAQAHSVAIQEANAAVARATADQQAALERLRQAELMLPLVAKQAQQQDSLRSQGFVSEAAALDKSKELVAAKQDRETQVRALQAAEAAVRQANAGAARVLADYQRELATERSRIAAELSAFDAELAKRQHRLKSLDVLAPVDGNVNSVADLSAGQVVQAGQQLLSVVPSSERLRFEGWIRNEDIAHVAPGMPAKVKLSAYPFQKYGWLEGEVALVGVDSETPKEMRNAQGEPLFYRIRVDLRAQQLTRDGESFTARPGMQAIVDVQIGKRTLLEYLTSPIQRTVLEAARER